MNSDEKKKSSKQTKFICYLRAPCKYLIKARDFYIKSMTQLSGKLDHSLALGCPIAHISTNLPESYRLSSSKSTRSEEDYSELMRVSSARSSSLRRQLIRKSPEKRTAGISRSFSVAIGRIDEEKPYEFGEQGKVKTRVCQRSGSYAIARSGY